MHLDLTGIIHLALDPGCDLVREDRHLVVRDLLGLDHDADLAARLNGKGLLDAGEVVCQLLELLQTLDVILEVLAPCARTRRRNGVGRLDDERGQRLGLHVAVVRLDRIDDLARFLMLLGDLYAELDVRALRLLRERLADVVQQTRALGHRHIGAELACQNAGSHPG